MKFISIKKNQRGFTLMEIIVVLAIFTITISIMADIFITSITAQRKIIVRQKLFASARYSIELMSRYIRTGTISYSDFSDPVLICDDEIYIRDNDDIKTFFKLCEGCGSCPAGVGKCLIMSIDEGITWDSVTPKGVEVDKLEFYIKPSTDPFIVGGPDVQPRATIILKLKNNSDLSSSYQSEVLIQTTISTRIYDR
ncbi:MAG: type II secretion system protein [Patescibacteria group bacterium]|nr:type II secretion system protein [Patescibacteria group bacterium]